MFINLFSVYRLFYKCTSRGTIFNISQIFDLRAHGSIESILWRQISQLFVLYSGYQQPWEPSDSDYPSSFASPLEIAIEASNGASDYGNKFGEPVIAGFARSFGMTSNNLYIHFAGFHLNILNHAYE